MSKRTTARHDEYCEWCGYPFDAGDNVFVANDDDCRKYCSRTCLTHDAKQVDAWWCEPTNGPDHVTDADLLCPEPAGGAA